MKPIDISGKRFGKLIAISFDHKGDDNRQYWKFQCDCGVIKIIRKSHVIDGRIKSCTCLWFKKGKDSIGYIHGMSNSKFYRAYAKIKEKCYTKNSKDYDHYGKRGIRCEWKSFEEFKKDMYKSFLKSIKINGFKNTTIDRINNNGNYSKKNCRWATYTEQERNRTNNVRYLFKGKNLTIPEWSEIYGIPIYTVYNRVKRKRITVQQVLKEWIREVAIVT